MVRRGDRLSAPGAVSIALLLLYEVNLEEKGFAHSVEVWGVSWQEC